MLQQQISKWKVKIVNNLNGFYQISSLDSGLYNLIVSAFGYENDTIRVNDIESFTLETN